MEITKLFNSLMQAVKLAGSLDVELKAIQFYREVEKLQDELADVKKERDEYKELYTRKQALVFKGGAWYIDPKSGIDAKYPICNRCYERTGDISYIAMYGKVARCPNCDKVFPRLKVTCTIRSTQKLI